MDRLRKDDIKSHPRSQRVEDSAFYFCRRQAGSAARWIGLFEDDGERFAEGAIFQHRGQSKSAAIVRATCRQTPALPTLPPHEIHASLRRRNRERCNDHWSGARTARARFAKTLCAHSWQDTFSLVRRILRDE